MNMIDFSKQHIRNMLRTFIKLKKKVKITYEYANSMGYNNIQLWECKIINIKKRIDFLRNKGE